MKKIKIGYFADGPWSHLAFEELIQKNYVEICFIVPRSDTADETLKNFGLRYHIPYLKGYNINSDEFYAIASEFNCDLFVSMSFNQIFKKRIIDLPPLKTINCHAGKLPFYRGRNILNWALINDEKDFGITVHYVDEGIDTGDIILQKTYPITDNDSYATLLERAYIGCSDVLTEAVELIANNKQNIVSQKNIHPVGFYCGKRGPGDEHINWNQNSRQLFNFIRAICAPGPQATTHLNNKKVTINHAKLITDAPNYIGTCGQIIGKTQDGFLVKTLDSFIEISEITFDGKLKVGDKFK